MTSSKKEDRILIVDDTIVNVQLLAALLQKEGYLINVAQDGLRALETVKEMPPDLILLDIMMPKMNGYETCIQLRKNPEYRKIPIIFLTAKMEPEDIVKGFQIGAVDYLTKPFNTEELLARVTTHLKLKHAYQEIEQQKKTLEQQNAELIESAKLREDVDQIIRHDLKTPLNPIIGYPQLLMRNEELSEKGQVYVKKIEDSGYRLLNMINLSLDLFKMERKVYNLRPIPVDLMPIFRQIETESKWQSRGKS